MGQTLELTRTFIKASERFLYKAPEPAAPEEDNQPAEAWFLCMFGCLHDAVLHVGLGVPKASPWCGPLGVHLT